MGVVCTKKSFMVLLKRMEQNFNCIQVALFVNQFHVDIYKLSVTKGESPGISLTTQQKKDQCLVTG